MIVRFQEPIHFHERENAIIILGFATIIPCQKWAVVLYVPSNNAGNSRLKAEPIFGCEQSMVAIPRIALNFLLRCFVTLYD